MSVVLHQRPVHAFFGIAQLQCVHVPGKLNGFFGKPNAQLCFISIGQGIICD